MYCVKYLKRGWIRSHKNDVSIAGGDTQHRFKYDRWDALPCLANCRERERERNPEIRTGGLGRVTWV